MSSESWDLFVVDISIVIYLMIDCLKQYVSLKNMWGVGKISKVQTKMYMCRIHILAIGTPVVKSEWRTLMSGSWQVASSQVLVTSWSHVWQRVMFLSPRGRRSSLRSQECGTISRELAASVRKNGNTTVYPFCFGRSLTFHHLSQDTIWCQSRSCIYILHISPLQTYANHCTYATGIHPVGEQVSMDILWDGMVLTPGVRFLFSKSLLSACFGQALKGQHSCSQSAHLRDRKTGRQRWDNACEHERECLDVQRRSTCLPKAFRGGFAKAAVPERRREWRWQSVEGASQKGQLHTLELEIWQGESDVEAGSQALVCSVQIHFLMSFTTVYQTSGRQRRILGERVFENTEAWKTVAYSGNYKWLRLTGGSSRTDPRSRRFNLLTE